MTLRGAVLKSANRKGRKDLKGLNESVRLALRQEFLCGHGVLCVESFKSS